MKLKSTNRDEKQGTQGTLGAQAWEQGGLEHDVKLK